MTAATAAIEAGAGTERRRWLAVSALLGATFVGTVNNSIANVAVPFIADDLDAGVSTTVWVVTAFALSLGTMMPLAGRIGDVYGPRRCFLGGAAGFAVASLIVGMSNNIVVAIVGRVVQGVSGSSVLPCIMATITRLFPAQQRGRALGMWAAVNAAALAAGPGLGGVIIDALGWRALFLLSAPAIAVVAVLVRLLVPADPPKQERPIDVKGALLMAATLLCVVLPITEVRSWGWTSPWTVGLLVAGAGGAWLLLHHVRVSADPFLDPALVRRPGFAAAAGVAGLQMVALFAVTFTVPVFYVVGRGTDAGAAGLVTSALPVSMLVGAFASGRLADRVRFGALAATGGFSMVAGCSVIAAGAPSMPVVAVGLAIVGAGISLIQTPAAVAVTRTAPAGQGGIAAGVFNSTRFVLGGLGATAAAIAFERFAGRTDGGAPDLGAALAGLRAGLAVAVAAGLAIVVAASRIAARRS